MNHVQSFAFGRGDAQAPVMLSGLDRLGEKLGRRIRALIEPISGIRPHVAAEDARVVEFGAWSAGAPNFCSLSIYRLLPLRGRCCCAWTPP